MNNINFSTGTKKILIKVFILIVVTINVGIFYGVYNALNEKQEISQNSAKYDVFLSEYLYQYSKNQKMFQNYSFFINYDQLLFQNGNSIRTQYYQSINDFSNITQEQFFSLNGLVNRLMSSKGYGDVLKFSFNHSDWSRKDAVIKDEKGFNVSYIFAVLTALQYQINNINNINKTQQWVTLSAQEIIDCCDDCLKNQTVYAVYSYIMANGVTEQKIYPYQNSRFDRAPKTCRRQNKKGKRYFIKGYKSIKNCQKLLKQLGKAPIVVGVDGRSFSNYQYSIFKDCQRKTTHYSTLVGVSTDYWKIQNSWGRKWGQRGFMRIGTGDTCGICISASVPQLKQE